jgi:hypothetical protein
MKCGVPTIGIQPNLKPEWMNETNGVWIKDETLLPELIADWSQHWLEDDISEDVLKNLDITIEPLPNKESFQNKVIEVFSGYLNTRAESMEEQISKFAE